MIRIRYNHSNGKLVSKDSFLSTNNLVYVILIPSTLEGFINHKEEVLTSFKAKTLPALKKLAKRQLQALGVVFKNELRARVKDFGQNEK